jgi:hypothetical protein
MGLFLFLASLAPVHAENTAPTYKGPRSYAARMEFAQIQYNKAVEAYKKDGPGAFFDSTTGVFEKDDRAFVLGLLRGLPELPTFTRKGEIMEISSGAKSITVAIKNRTAGTFLINGKSFQMNSTAPAKETYEKMVKFLEANADQKSAGFSLRNSCEVAVNYVGDLLVPRAHAQLLKIAGYSLLGVGLVYLGYNIVNTGSVQSGVHKTKHEVADALHHADHAVKKHVSDALDVADEHPNNRNHNHDHEHSDGDHHH